MLNLQNFQVKIDTFRKSASIMLKIQNSFISNLVDYRRSSSSSQHLISIAEGQLSIPRLFTKMFSLSFQTFHWKVPMTIRPYLIIQKSQIFLRFYIRLSLLQNVTCFSMIWIIWLFSCVWSSDSEQFTDSNVHWSSDVQFDSLERFTRDSLSKLVSKPGARESSPKLVAISFDVSTIHQCPYRKSLDQDFSSKFSSKLFSK